MSRASPARKHESNDATPLEFLEFEFERDADGDDNDDDETESAEDTDADARCSIFRFLGTGGEMGSGDSTTIGSGCGGGSEEWMFWVAVVPARAESDLENTFFTPFNGALG